MNHVMLVGAIARRHGLTRQAVRSAIHAGRLPATLLDAGGGRKFFAIDPEDADALWGQQMKVSA
ncbi:hypothetical protein [Mycobacteroides abscessus]|uniref:hypothetical protein n=1 Tax=Mycobacteroides abscessus TaxID=36809 RepID=UPI0018969ECF|nr:hypothetical protein [Mycobacteroides abscessus]